jgi:hypothetical protein
VIFIVTPRQAPLRFFSALEPRLARPYTASFGGSRRIRTGILNRLQRSINRPASVWLALDNRLLSAAPLSRVGVAIAPNPYGG